MAETLTERIVSLPVINPENPRGLSKTFVFMGKVDHVEDGVVVDWKGCGSPLKYIKKLKIDWQPYLYAAALQHEGIEVRELQYRLIASPQLKFCNKDADITAYEERVYEWILERPSERLVEHQLFLNQAKLKQAKALVWDCCKRILDSRRTQRWLPNAHACQDFNRECECYPLCEAVANGSDLQWVIDQFYEKVALHRELGDYEADKDVVTYSSLDTLMLCEMKYFWKQERGLHKRHDYSEAMWTGSAMHAGLDAIVDGGLDGAYEAIDEWEKHNPALGESVKYVDQQVAKARAMTRAAAKRWLSGSE